MTPHPDTDAPDFRELERTLIRTGNSGDVVIGARSQDIRDAADALASLRQQRDALGRAYDTCGRALKAQIQQADEIDAALRQQMVSLAQRAEQAERRLEACRDGLNEAVHCHLTEQQEWQGNDTILRQQLADAEARVEALEHADDQRRQSTKPQVIP